MIKKLDIAKKLDQIMNKMFATTELNFESTYRDNSSVVKGMILILIPSDKSALCPGLCNSFPELNIS
jgi:hypothetical protein